MNLEDYLINKMETLNIVEKEDVQLYKYGLRNIYIISLNLLTATIVSIILHKIENVLLFLCMFSFVRVFAGGYHAKNRSYCYFLSNLCLIIPIYGNYIYSLLNVILKYMSFGAMCIFIIYLSPVESADREYDLLESKYFKRRTIIAVVIEMVLFVIYEIVSAETAVSYAIYSSFLVVTLLLVIGKINKNKQKKIAVTK